MRFAYPDPESEVRDYNWNQFERVYRSHGAKNPEELFGDAPKTTVPWPQAGRRKDRASFDQARVSEALSGERELQRVDPRNLHATQPGITRAGVDYYLGDEYKETGRTFADQEQAGNRFPVVYDREDGQSLLLSGHHRGAAALLRGEEFDAIRTQGPWGPERGR